MVSTSYPCQAPNAPVIENQRSTTAVRRIVAAGTAAAMLGLASVALAADADVQKLQAAAPANAKVLAAQILSRWAPVAQAAGLNMSVWQEQFTTQLSLMSLNSLSGLDRAEVKSDIDAKANYAIFADAFRAALMVRHMESKKGNAKLGSPTTDQVFIPIVPCRVVDTRNVGGQIAAGFTRNYDFYASTAGFDFSTQGGAAGAASTACPGTVNPNGGAPSAAMMTVTVVSPSDAGNWVIWGGANPVPTASALNWSGPGQILANTTVAPGGGRAGTGPGGAILDFAVKYNGPIGNAHFIADVVGWP